MYVLPTSHLEIQMLHFYECPECFTFLDSVLRNTHHVLIESALRNICSIPSVIIFRKNWIHIESASRNTYIALRVVVS
jgi:hypothetical protein